MANVLECPERRKWTAWRKDFPAGPFVSPPDIRILRLFILPLAASRSSLGPVAGRSAPGVGVCVALATSLALGTSAGLLTAGLREVVTCFAVVAPGDLGPVALELALGRRRGRPLDGRRAETQDGAQTSPVLLTLSLDAVRDGLLHLLPTGQQQVHQVHVGSGD